VLSARRGHIGNSCREHPVADPFGDGCSFGPVRSDQHFDIDGPVGHEPFGLQHADRRALPLDSLASQQRPQGHDVLLDGCPPQRPLPKGVSSGESRADGDGHPARCHGSEGGDGRSVGHRVAKVRYQYARAETDG
jgi:hypothetical protein